MSLFQFVRNIVMLFVLGALLISSGCTTAEHNADTPKQFVDHVYISGSLQTNDNLWKACYWIDGVCTDLPPLSATMDSHAYCVFTTANDVYFGGDTVSTNKYVFPCFWKNGARSDMYTEEELTYLLGKVTSYFVSGNTAYMAGIYQSKPYYWTSHTRFALDASDVPIGLCEANSIYVTNGDIYIGGYYYLSPPYITCPCYWKNGKRYDLEFDASYRAARTGAICASGGDVYITGTLTAKQDEVDVPCYWKNGQLNLLATPNGPPNYGHVTALFTVDGDVYIGGVTSFNGACYWKNGQYVDISKPSDTYMPITGICVQGSDVYLSGYYLKPDNELIPCYIKNGVRTDLSIPDGVYQAIPTGISVTRTYK